MVEISEVTYGQFGRCVRLCDGKNELLATLDFGPRIIKFCALERENIFFEDVNDAINADSNAEELASFYGKDAGVWHIRGGHRLWKSPEDCPGTYFPDNVPVSYEKIENGIKLLPPPQHGINLQFSIEVTMPEENCVHLVHTIKNLSETPISLAPWSLSVLSPGGTEIIPVPTRKTHYIGTRHLVFWQYTKMNDPRITWGDKYLRLRQDPEAETPFKFGMLSQHGWAAYFNHGDAFIKYFDTNEGLPHPDRDCNFETFTNRYMLEMESLGVLRELQSGAEISHSECWSFYPNVSLPANDDETDDFAKKFVE